MKAQNQTVLTLIMGLVMISAFVGVYYVSAQYENSKVSELVYSSDSNLEFSEIDTSITSPAIPQPYGLGSYKTTSGGTIWSKNNATGVYLGNNTWGASMIGWAAETPLYSSALYYIPIDIPEAKTFLADNISINITLPSELITLQIYIGGYNIPDTGIITSSVQLFAGDSSANRYDNTFVLSSYQKLQWASACKQYDMPFIGIFIYDTGKDGISTYAMEIEVSITGVPLSTWSLQDSVTTVVGICTGLNIVVGIYMLDGVDFNAIRKDLSNKTKGYTKKKNGGR